MPVIALAENAVYSSCRLVVFRIQPTWGLLLAPLAMFMLVLLGIGLGLLFTPLGMLYTPSYPCQNAIDASPRSGLRSPHRVMILFLGVL
jgi:ABC-type polysaccharide/polyol phosphate export permease